MNYKLTTPMKPSVLFTRVEQYYSRRFRDVMQIYHTEFPADSRLSLTTIRQLLKTSRYQLHVAQDQDTARVIAFALIWICPRPAFVHLDYIAVKQECKGQGIGTALYRWLAAHLKTLASRAELLTLEVEEALIGFYRRSQTRLLQHVPYLFPGPRGPIPMHLMVYDRRGRSTLDRALVQNLIRALYRGLHHREAKDAILRSFLSRVPQPVLMV